jgi:hypothetical protein
VGASEEAFEEKRKELRMMGRVAVKCLTNLLIMVNVLKQ